AVGVRVENPNAPSLTDEQVRELAKTSIAIENAFGTPQDIEFAFDANGLWILQARPITTIEEYGPAAGNRLLWDNSNIVESFSGVTSPMTFSVIRRAYAIVYRLFAQVMGIPERVVKENKYVFENTLGLFRGQVFYNLLNWYAMVRLFPGYEQNRKFMESMMGVRETTAAPEQKTSRLAMLPLVWRLMRNFARINKLTAEFEANFKTHYDRWSSIDFDALRPHELMQLYYEFEDRVLWSWRAPIINDFFVLKRARTGVRNRENMRFARTRIFGLVREVVRAMGRRLTEEHILDSPGDVFYLGLEELWDYVKGTALTTDLRGLAALRKKEFD